MNLPWCYCFVGLIICFPLRGYTWLCAFVHQSVTECDMNRCCYIAGVFPATARPFIVRGHTTSKMKLFTAKCHERATRQTGNSSLLPAKCWPAVRDQSVQLKVAWSKSVFQNLLFELFCVNKIALCQHEAQEILPWSDEWLVWFCLEPMKWRLV